MSETTEKSVSRGDQPTDPDLPSPKPGHLMQVSPSSDIPNERVITGRRKRSEKKRHDGSTEH